MRSAEPATMLQKGPLDLLGAPASSSAKASGKAVLESRTRRYPTRTNGKVFFTLGAVDYECSGTAIQSANRSLVWTAGHCVYDPGVLGAGEATHWEFVPGYNHGAKPFGEWPAQQLRTTSQWRSSAGISEYSYAFDLGAATVARRKGKRLEDVIGARRIAFGQPRGMQYKAYGYPAEPPFDGEHLYRCTSGYQGADDSEGPPHPIRIVCDMTAGASGGGWVIRRPYRHHFRHYLVSVTSYTDGADPGFLYGPYQGGVARELYNSAAGG